MPRQPKFYRTQEFTELNKLWQEKLKEGGFQDLEKGGEARFLKDEGMSNFMRNGSFNFVGFKASELYYQLAGQFLFSHKFATLLEKYIWREHAEGISIRKIIKQPGFLSLCTKDRSGDWRRVFVDTTIRALRLKMYQEKKKEIEDEAK